MVTASLGQVIDQRRFADMPIAHGNPYLLMTLSAGVVYTSNAGLDRPFEPGHTSSATPWAGSAPCAARSRSTARPIPCSPATPRR